MKTETQSPSWEVRYERAEYWQPDLEFLKDEQKFLNDLIGKFFIRLVKEECITDIQQLTNELQKLTPRGEEILEDVKKIFKLFKGSDGKPT